MNSQIFRERLRDFPHFFQINDLSELTPTRQRNLLDRLKTERNDDSHYRTPLENTCICNIIAFLSFLRSDINEAIEEANATLKSPNNDTNIVALANMAVMRWKMRGWEEAERLVDNLEELRGRADFNDKVFEAKAEMAYFYARMGTKSALLAVELFEEVVQARPQNYAWKYSLALVLRRFTHINYRMYYRMSPEESSSRSLKAFDLLVEVGDNGAPEILRARALTELGMLLEQSALLHDLRNLKERAKRSFTPEQCFEEAVRLAPKDVHVLTYSGKYFRKDNVGKSCELLERAIEIRPTTTAHHYLGNTFVKMAKIRQRDQSRRQGQQHRRPDFRRRSATQRQYEVQRWDYKKMIKISIQPASLRPDNQYVKHALHHFQESIKLSHGDNPPAIYDLGVLYVTIGDDDQALEQFTILTNQSESLLTPLQMVNAYEQSGLIFTRKMSVARDERKKKDYATECRRMLQAALQIQCQYVASLHVCEPDLNAGRTFSDLCLAAKGTVPKDIRVNELNRLLEMIKDYAEYMNVLQEISRLRPQETSNSMMLETKLSDYISREQYDDALLFLSLLETTKEKEKVPQWSDPELPTRLRVMAARKKLSNLTEAPSVSTDETIKRCFLQAIPARPPHPPEESQEDTNGKWWHVMILHDLNDDMKVKSIVIKDILRNVCGLSVTCVSEDDGDFSDNNDHERIIARAKRSRILLLLCGPNEFLSEFWENLLMILLEMLSIEGSRCKTLVALLMDNAELPANLHPDRSLQCPPALFQHSKPYSPDHVSAVIGLFCFLVDLTIDNM